MKFKSFSPGEKGRSLWSASLGIIVPTLLLGTSAVASPTTFSDGNSSVTIDPNVYTGMSSWTVDGQNVLNQQSLWLGVGSSSVAPISSISSPIVTSASTSPGFSSLATTYNNSQVSVTAVYSLVGGPAGSGNSDLSEQIQLKNLTGSALTFHFYQYADFRNVSSVALTTGSSYFGDAYVNGTGMLVHESLNTGVIPGPSFGETEAAGVTLAKLMGGTPGTLDGSTMGNAGYTWAFEWDKTVGAGSSLIISKDLNATLAMPVPEPTSWSLISVGLFSLGLMKRQFDRRGK